MGGRGVRASAISAALLLLSVPLARAEQLPFRRYTIADGLARDTVQSITPDSRGFIWLGTVEGLSRFDGYAFTSFGQEEGLPGRVVYDLIETRDGTFYVATDAGLARLDPRTRFPTGVPGSAAAPLFQAFLPPDGLGTRHLRTLLETRDGSILVGTFGGLFRFHPGSGKFETIDLRVPPGNQGRFQINDLLEAGDGDLWIATRYLGLLQLHPDGRQDRYLEDFRPPLGNIRALAFDGNGGLWAGGWDGLRHLVRGPDGRRLVRAESYLSADGLPSNQIYALYRTGDGRLVVATTSGVAIGSPVGAGLKLTPIGPRQGLALIRTLAVSEDRSGNLWIGSDGSGVFKLARDGFTSFGATDGLPGPFCASFLTDRQDRLFASTHTAAGQTILNRLDGAPGAPFRINIPSRIVYRGWGSAQLTLQDREGDWWVPTGQGLVRFSGKRRAEDLAVATPAAIYTVKDGLTSDDIYRIFEDPRGDIWVSATGLVRFVRSRGRFVLEHPEGPSAFGEDGAGNTWVGFWSGELLRYRGEIPELFTARDGVPVGTIQSIFRDRRGRLWIGSADGGVARVDDPGAPRPVFTRATPAEGLSSRQVNCITEDAWGRIYLGTGRGVDRLDSERGHVRHFTTADGLVGSEIILCAADRNGTLWFSTLAGLSKLVPAAPAPVKPPEVLISELSIAGVRQPIALRGESALSDLVLSPDQRQVEIGFLGLDYSAGERLRYQVRLDGAEETWSAPDGRRSVHYAHLAPGEYRFHVRAIDSDGQASPVPATIGFTIERPVWQRGWFLVLAATFLGGATYALLRYRLAQLLRLERVRTRIAADLHDDIGASLSRIALQSELARRRSPGEDPGRAERLLADIGDSARALVDSMSDIVWSIDPRRDDLGSVVSRVRQFALDLLEPKGIDLEIDAPPNAEQLRLDPEARRQLFLMLKEAVHNIAKHSGGGAARIRLRREGDRLAVEVRDDGRGFAVEATEPGGSGTRGGHGLRNMRRRASQVGGSFHLESAPGRGTVIRLTLPVGGTGA